MLGAHFHVHVLDHSDIRVIRPLIYVRERMTREYARGKDGHAVTMIFHGHAHS